MGLPARTAKSLARILLEETGNEEKAANILNRWNEISGTNGIFRSTITDILSFVEKLGSKKPSENIGRENDTDKC